MGDRASAPEAGKNNAAAGQAAHADIQAANLASLLSGNTPSSRGLQTPADEGWGQLQGKLTGTEHGISNPADRYAHLTDPLAGYSTEGSNGYGHGEDDLFAGDGLDMSEFVDQPVPGTAGAFLADRAAEGQAWMDAHENGNPADVVSDTPKGKTKPGTGVDKNGNVKRIPDEQIQEQELSQNIENVYSEQEDDSLMSMNNSLEKEIIIRIDPERQDDPDAPPPTAFEYYSAESEFEQELREDFGVPPPGPGFLVNVVNANALILNFQEKVIQAANWADPERQDDPDAPPPANPDDVPPPPERGDVDPVPGGTTPKKGELPPDPGNPPQDNGVIDPPDELNGGGKDSFLINTLPEDDVFGGTINPGPGDA